MGLSALGCNALLPRMEIVMGLFQVVSGGEGEVKEGTSAGSKFCRVSRRSSFRGKRKPASLGDGVML